MRRTTTCGGPPPPVDLHNPDQVRAADRRDVALALLSAGFADAPNDVVFRRELLLRFVERLDGALRRDVLRRLAEGIQVLELVGAVCEDVEQSSDGFYFASAMGRYLLNSSAPPDELMMRLPS